MSKLIRTRRLIWAAFLFVFTLALALSYVSGVARVEHVRKVEDSLNGMLSALREEESESRGFTISGDPAFLERTRRSRDDYAAKHRALQELVGSNASQAEFLRRLEPLVAEKHAFMATLMKLRQQGQLREGAALISSGRGRLLMDRVRQAIEDIRAEEHRLRGLSANEADAMQYQTLTLIVSGVVVTTLLLVATYISIRRSAKRLLQTTQELAESEERYRTLADEMSRVAENLALSEEGFRILVENACELVRLHGTDGGCYYVSGSVKKLLGYTPEELIRKSPFELVHPEDLGAAKQLREELLRGVVSPVLNYRLRHSDGEYRCFEVAFMRVDDSSGAVRHYQSVGRDVTRRRELEQRLAEQAAELREQSLRDGLTGLYNRRGLLELSAQMVRVAQRERHRLALLFIDLDGLKSINDQLGHNQGDRAIQDAGALLHATCRESDLVARLGGDEFVVLAANIDEAGTHTLQTRLERALAASNAERDRPYRLAFSVGISHFDPQGPIAIDRLISEADAHMYERKRERRATQLCAVSDAGPGVSARVSRTGVSAPISDRMGVAGR